ncbi:hypothetical protein TNCV_2847641 [Trichonephila clavipes]|nr:hypothetical protein TNCV_2847641 [Trichonephila clavipes]
MFRSDGQSDAKPPVLSSKTSLVLIYRPTEGMKGRVSRLAQPGFEPRTCGVEARYTNHSATGFQARINKREIETDFYLCEIDNRVSETHLQVGTR